MKPANSRKDPPAREIAMVLVRIVAPHFVAGFVTDGVVRRAAPIIAYMIGWDDDRVRAYVRGKSWKASIINEGSARSEDGGR